MPYSVVIPSKTESNLRECCKAIRLSGERNPILVMDDGVDWKEDEYPFGDHLIVATMCDSPFIYARNCNIGIRESDDDDVILLNDDALLKSPGGFAALSRAAEENPEYGIISAATNVSGNPDQVPRSYLCGLRETLRCAAFVCIYIPRRTIDLVGLLDERFTTYGYEDQDYCRRVRNAGLKVGILDACYVDHGSLRSTFRGDPRAPGDCAAGAAIYKAKWGDLD